MLAGKYVYCLYMHTATIIYELQQFSMQHAIKEYEQDLSIHYQCPKFLLYGKVAN